MEGVSPSIASADLLMGGRGGGRTCVFIIAYQSPGDRCRSKILFLVALKASWTQTGRIPIQCCMRRVEKGDDFIKNTKAESVYWLFCRRLCLYPRVAHHREQRCQVICRKLSNMDKGL
jgi:hypothetical protein